MLIRCLDRSTFSEIVYKVKKGGLFPIRPEIITDIHDVNPALIALVKDCWAEVPEDRPTAENICSQMKGLVSKYFILLNHFNF